MKTQLPGWVEKSRVTAGPMTSHPGTGPNGAFLLKFRGETYRDLAIIASTGSGWDHVIVRIAITGNQLMPTWDEMRTVKDLFFHPHECAYQYHPRQSDYVDFHPPVLHLWRPHRGGVPTPPTWMIGPKGNPWLTGEES